MFDQLIITGRTGQKTRKWIYFSTTATLWISMLAALVITGIFAFDGKLADMQMAFLLAPPPPSAPPPAPPAGSPAPSGAVIRGLYSSEKSPTEITNPPKVRNDDFSSYAASGLDTGVIGGVEGGSAGYTGRVAGVPSYEPPPPAPEPEPVKKVEPPPVQKTVVPRTSVFLQGSAIAKPQPPYPQIAKLARIQGPVVVEVIIDEEGNVMSAHALSGHPSLREAAVGAARHWRWQPTLLNGVPVKITGTLTFNFILN